MGLMRRKTFWGAGPVLAAWMALGPAGLRAQGPFNSDYAPGAPGYAPAVPQLPVPLGSTRPEDGGLFLAAQGALYSTTNPLKSQPLAYRGFIVTDPNLVSSFTDVFPFRLPN